MPYSGNSIVDYLKSVGQSSDYGSRTKMASQYGIGGYTGTADQNLKLLSALRAGGAAPAAPVAPGGASPVNNGGSLAGTLPPEAPTGALGSPASSLGSPPVGSMAAMQSVLRNITRTAYAQGPTSAGVLDEFNKGGVNLTTPQNIGQALASETRSRAGGIQDIYNNAIDLVKENDRLAQERAQKGMALFQMIAQEDTLRPALAQLKPDELSAWINGGVVPDSFLHGLAGAIASAPPSSSTKAPFTNADVQARAKTYYDSGDYSTFQEAVTAARRDLSAENNVGVSGGGSSSSFDTGGLSSGGSNAGDLSKLSTLYKDGANGGQCGVFVHKILDNVPSMGDTIQSKMAMIDQKGIKAAEWRNNPQVGDMLIFNTRLPFGHAGVVNKVNPDGSVTLTESNWRGTEQVTNTRTVKLNDPTIYGAYRGGTVKGGSGAPASSQNGTPTFEQYLQQKQEEKKLSFAPPLVEKTRQEYNRLYNNQDSQQSTQQATPEMKGLITNALNSIKRFLPSSQIPEFKRDINSYIKSGDITNASNTLRQAALASLGAADETSYLGRENAIEQMGNVKQLLSQYQSKGGDTNIFVGTEQQVLNKIGKTKNQDLAALQSRILQSLQNYRRSMTGVAFGAGEQKEYEKLFPNGGTDYNLNMTLIDTLSGVAQETNDTMLRVKMGFSQSQYNQLFPRPAASLPSSAGSSGFSITAPNGKTYSFPDQNSLNAFKQAANL